MEVEQLGAACHLGTRSCFTEPVGPEPAEAAAWTTVGALLATLEARQRERPEGSYTTMLFDKGVDRIGKKVVEEAGEVILAAKNVEFGLPAGRDELIYETADLLFHTLVLLQHCALPPHKILEELRRRFRTEAR